MNEKRPEEVLQPVAAVMAVAAPGLGYLYFGDRRRAAAVFLSITGLFGAGVYIGGIDCVDSVEDRWWFLVQALNGPLAFAVDWVHQTQFKVEYHGASGPMRITPPPASARMPGAPAQTLTKSLGKVNEAGTLYTAMAGMVNLIAIIDCLWHAPPRRRRGNA